MKRTSCQGPLYSHLGHFSKQEHLDRGHNDSGTMDFGDASSQPSMKALRRYVSKGKYDKKEADLVQDSMGFAKDNGLIDDQDIRDTFEDQIRKNFEEQIKKKRPSGTRI